MKRVYETLKHLKAYEHAQILLSWDRETEMPKDGFSNLLETTEILSQDSYRLITNKDFREHVKNIDKSKISEIDKLVLEKLEKEVFEKFKIPEDLYTRFNLEKATTANLWEKGRREKKYEDYGDSLIKLIQTNKEMLDYIGYDKTYYDKLLSDYEKGLTIEIADEFFKYLKQELVPLIKTINETKNIKLENAKNKFYSIKYDILKQKELSRRISEELGFNYARGVLKESEHPFTTNLSKNTDVRITSHYYEDNPLNGLYSTIHETGHGIYEQNISDDLMSTYLLNQGVSMGIHESQSRMYENMIGKHDEFIKYLYELFIEYFSIDKVGVSLEEFNLIVNEVNNSIIRTDTDELTYSMHILIRYELEKEIFNKLTNIDKYDLLDKWNKKYLEYIGKKSDDLTLSIMQDVHWSESLFGYFPSYALGSAYAAQLYKAMDKEINVSETIKNREFNKIKDYLTEKIYKYGATKNPLELIENATKEKFNPKYYTEYLVNKYKKIYGID